MRAFVFILPVLALTACASGGGKHFGEQATRDSAARAELAQQWYDGDKMIAEGHKKIEDGNKMIADGERMIKDGEQIKKMAEDAYDDL